MKSIITIYIACILTLLPFNSSAQVSQQWVARYNGPVNDADVANAITVDDSGYVYVTGGSTGSVTNFDYLTIKYNNNGFERWIRRYNDSLYGNGFDLGTDITVDKFYNVYVTGTTITLKYDLNGNLLWKTNFPFTSVKIFIDSLNNVYVGGRRLNSYIVAKYSSNGDSLWARIYNGPNFDDRARDMAIDRSGNIIITGQSENQNFDWDYATVKYSNNGNLLWVRRYNGPAQNDPDDVAYGITVDDSSNIYVTGGSDGSNETADVLTIKYNSDGDILWTARYNGVNQGGDVGYDIIVDTISFVYVVGKTDGGNYVTIKYDRNGNLVWASRFLSNALLTLNFPRVKLDPDRNVYTTATTYRTGNFSNYGVIKYNNNGVQQWIVEYFCKGGFYNYVRGMALDNQNNVYVTGEITCLGTNNDYGTIKYSQKPIGIINNNTLISEYFELDQNFPNPFNQKTTIIFQVNREDEYILTVYNLLGIELAKLISQKLKPGKYKINWDASNFSSGIYFYAFKSSKHALSKRMIYLK